MTWLLSLTVNGQEEKLVANNVFKTQIAIQKPEERVRIAAVDKAGRKATLEFVIVDRGAAKAAGGAGAQQQAERVGWPSREKVPFGNYYALVIGNPARVSGWVCACGTILTRKAVPPGSLTCSACGSTYRGAANVISPQG